MFIVSIQSETSKLEWIGCSMGWGPLYTDLTYMGGTGPSLPMMIIFGSVI